MTVSSLMAITSESEMASVNRDRSWSVGIASCAANLTPADEAPRQGTQAVLAGLVIEPLNTFSDNLMNSFALHAIDPLSGRRARPQQNDIT
jgi:hypothetical protein